MAEKLLEELQEIISCLESAGRIGAPFDIPEGARFIKVSDTLAEKITFRLKKVSEYLSIKKGN